MRGRIRGLFRTGLAVILLGVCTPVLAIDTAMIMTSALSPDCLSYRVVGICYWLYCTMFGCSVRTSVKVRHYVPDAVVSSYSNTGESPWAEVAFMSPPNASARAGGDGTTNQSHENNLAKSKNADAGRAMTADQLIAEAAENRPLDPPPSLDNVERGLRQLLESMLSAFDYKAQFGSGAALACRVHALLIAEVQALRRMRTH